MARSRADTGHVDSPAAKGGARSGGDHSLWFQTSKLSSLGWLSFGFTDLQPSRRFMGHPWSKARFAEASRVVSKDAHGRTWHVLGRSFWRKGQVARRAQEQTWF